MSTKRLTKEIFQERSNRKHDNSYIILGDYINNRTKILILHKKCNKEYLQIPDDHLRGCGCPFCGLKNKTKTKEKFIEESNSKFGNNYSIIGDYINADKKIEIKHNLCDTIFKTKPRNFLSSKQGGCPTCFRSFTKTKEQFQIESNNLHNDEYVILSDYINSNTKILIRHKICGSDFYQTPSTHLSDRGCPYCGDVTLSNEEFQFRSDNMNNCSYLLIGDYINQKTPVVLKHNICGNTFSQIASTHLLGGQCTICYPTISIGEARIKNILDSNNIKYIEQHKFDECKYKIKLRFDFYLPDYNTCIEYDGAQHSKSIKYFGGDDKLSVTKIRDKIKNNYCINNNINLIRISYSDRIKPEYLIKNIYKYENK